MSRRSLLSLTSLLAASPLLALATALPASAHVTVQPPTQTQGAADVLIAFRAPNEMDDATTTKLQVKFPTDNPIASVSVTPIAGWTVDVQMAKLATPITTDDGTVTDAVSQITWTATGAGIPVGNFQDFDVDAGPMPAVASIGFPTLQTYSNGMVVSWVDPVVEGQPEPDHPTPTLQLDADPDASATPSASASASVVSKAQAGPAAATSVAKTSDGTARALGIAGIVVGVLGLGSGLVLGRRRTS